MEVVAGACSVRALKGLASDCTRILIVLTQQLHYFQIDSSAKVRSVPDAFPLLSSSNRQDVEISIHRSVRGFD